MFFSRLTFTLPQKQIFYFKSYYLSLKFTPNSFQPECHVRRPPVGFRASSRRLLGGLRRQGGEKRSNQNGMRKVVLV